MTNLGTHTLQHIIREENVDSLQHAVNQSSITKASHVKFWLLLEGNLYNKL